MNRSEIISYPVADAAAAGLAAAWAKVRDVFAGWGAAHSRALAIRELQGLSDRALRDIGLERADISHAVHMGRLPWS